MHQCGDCVSQQPQLDQCLAAVDYAYPWSRLITEFKFREHTAWASTFATLMRSAPWVEPALDEADLVIPLPLSTQRLRERGFNQTLLLARALAPAKLADRILLRILDSAPQSSLPRKERLSSLVHAYAVDPLSGTSLEGKRIVLLDDVMTTGATLNAAAQCVRQAGAAHITGMVFARTS